MNVSKIHDYIGNAVAITLPAMFVLTGCDAVSYFYRKSKKAILERILKQEVLEWLLLTVRKYEVNDSLQLLYEQPSTGIHNASMKIENSCQISEKSIWNEVVGVRSF